MPTLYIYINFGDVLGLSTSRVFFSLATFGAEPKAENLFPKNLSLEDNFSVEIAHLFEGDSKTKHMGVLASFLFFIRGPQKTTNSF